MPEYLALIHHRNKQDSDGSAPDFTAGELNDLFLRMDRAGVAKVVN